MGFCRLLVSGYRDLAFAHVAQLVERVLGKDEVISSILIMGSRYIEIKAKIDITTPGESNG
jgi:hypothetical protein